MHSLGACSSKNAIFFSHRQQKKKSTETRNAKFSHCIFKACKTSFHKMHLGPAGRDVWLRRPRPGLSARWIGSCDITTGHYKMQQHAWKGEGEMALNFKPRPAKD